MFHKVSSLTEAGSDYVAVIRERLNFPRGSLFVCHNVTILQDSDCEHSPENFFSDLSLESGVGDIRIRPETEVLINDTREPECGS